MNLVNDNKSNILDKVPGLPWSGHSVPLLRSGHNHTGLRYSSSIRSRVSSQLHNFLTKLSLKPAPPVTDSLPDQSLVNQSEISIFCINQSEIRMFCIIQSVLSNNLNQSKTIFCIDQSEVSIYLERSNVDHLGLGSLSEDSEHGQLCHNSFTRTCARIHNHCHRKQYYSPVGAPSSMFWSEW